MHRQPLFRIALCGYEGEHEMPESWSVFSWAASGGLSRKPDSPRAGNRHRERIWFSPHCLRDEAAEGLFGGDWG